MNFFRLIAVLALAFSLPGCRNDAGPPAADTVLYNGAVYTMNDAAPRASAVAVRDGAIVFVGDNDTARTFMGTDTTSVDLRGRMLLPGFHDTHAHVLAGGSSLIGCNMNDERNGERVREMLHDCLAEFQYADDEWVIGSRWALAAFPDGNPRKEWLDEVFGDRPAYFVDSFSHTAWVSSRALEIAGIDANTENPAQGLIERNPKTGIATGTLRDAAMELVARHIPEDDDDAVIAGIERGLQEAAQFGITAYIDPGLDERYAQLYADMDRRGALTARVLGSLSPLAWHAGQIKEGLDDLLAKRTGWRGQMFRADSVKVYIDGVIETKTSNMLVPYSDGSNFPTFYTSEALNALFEKLHKEGVQIHTHAIGDGAIRLALDAYEYARDKVGPLDNRHHIVHLQLIDEADIPRFGELGVAASFQGAWAYPDEYIYIANELVGEERVQKFYPVASIQRSGGMLVGGSDWDVSSLNPLDAIEILVRRRDPNTLSGPELGDNEEIDLDTALRAYTVNAAHLMGLENISGRIDVGKRADLIVLDRDLYEFPPTDINAARVQLTLVNGREVFRSTDF